MLKKRKTVINHLPHGKASHWTFTCLMDNRYCQQMYIDQEANTSMLHSLHPLAFGIMSSPSPFVITQSQGADCKQTLGFNVLVLTSQP